MAEPTQHPFTRPEGSEASMFIAKIVPTPTSDVAVCWPDDLKPGSYSEGSENDQIVKSARAEYAARG